LQKIQKYKEELVKQQLEKERITKEKLEREKLENDRKEKEKLRESINKTVSDIVNANIEKVRQELINKTVLETSKAVEKAMTNSTISQKNDSVHRGVSCNECGIFPIVGDRYKCTVCFDFDLCESCEATKGETHSHPLVKHRKPADENYKQGLFGFFNGLNPFKPNQPQKKDFKECKKGGRKHKFMKEAQELKTTYDLSQFNDTQIYESLLRAKGDQNLALEYLMNCNYP